MVFNSYSFILLFLPVCVALFHLSKRLHRPLIPKLVLLFASLFFYGYHNLKALAVLCVSIVLNYLFARLASPKHRLAKVSLSLGITLDVLALLYCKYLLFFEGICNRLFSTALSATAILVPLGISFFTFSQIAYLVDCYRDENNACRFLDYALFVAFFPKVTVGPIALSTEMIPSFDRAASQPCDPALPAKGLTALAFGLAKKMLLADTLAKYADWGYLHVEGLGTVNALIVMLAYTLQIYFDFSGVCDMARGICLMLGMDLPQNFNSPYRALSIDDFWRRWHITLTRFFRNYVYFPLGGNRRGKIRTLFNRFFIFLLSGLWHGASLNFLIWGALHGAGLICSKALSSRTAKWPRLIRFGITFLFVNLTWVFFRAPDLKTACLFFRELLLGGIGRVNVELIVAATPVEGNFLQWVFLTFTPVPTYVSGLIMILGVLGFAFYASVFMKNTDERISSFVPSRKLAAACAALLVFGILSLSGISRFIYANF